MEGICTCYPRETRGDSREDLTRVPMWVPAGEMVHRYDFCCQAVEGEVPMTFCLGYLWT